MAGGTERERRRMTVSICAPARVAVLINPHISLAVVKLTLAHTDTWPRRAFLISGARVEETITYYVGA